MMRLMKSLEKQYEMNFFDRLMITFLVKDKPEMLPFNQVGYALEKGYINESTLVFNNSAVTNKKQLLESWLIPLKESWLGERVL
jgi:hypothetical protein